MMGIASLCCFPADIPLEPDRLPVEIIHHQSGRTILPDVEAEGHRSVQIQYCHLYHPATLVAAGSIPVGKVGAGELNPPPWDPSAHDRHDHSREDRP